MLLLVVACARAEAPRVDAGAGSPPGLGSTLDVRVAGDTVHFALHITNVTNGPLALEFGSAQRHDFEVVRGEDVVWRWSGDRMFAQVVGTDVLPAGETRRYEGTWLANGARGEYVATGRLTAMNFPVELRTTFQLPGR